MSLFYCNFAGISADLIDFLSLIIIKWGNCLDTHPKALIPKQTTKDIFRFNACTQTNAVHPLQWTELWSAPWLPLVPSIPHNSNSQNSYSAFPNPPQNKPNVTSKEECSTALCFSEPRRHVQIAVSRDLINQCSRKSQIRQKGCSKKRRKTEMHASEGRPADSLTAGKFPDKVLAFCLKK